MDESSSQQTYCWVPFRKNCSNGEALPPLFQKKKRLDLAPFAKSLEDLFYNDISTSVTTACSLHHQTKLGQFGSYLLPKSKMFSTHFIRKQKLDPYDLSYLRGSKVTTNVSLFL